jgi:hypothetical protein
MECLAWTGPGTFVGHLRGTYLCGRSRAVLCITCEHVQGEASLGGRGLCIPHAGALPIRLEVVTPG